LEITEVQGIKGDEIVLNPLYRFIEKGSKKDKVIGKLDKINELTYTEKLNRAGISMERNTYD
jgi:pilus assembly protein CpaF